MNDINIKEYLKNNLIDEKSLIVNYNFNYFSGNFIKNEVFKNEPQFSGNNNNVYLEGIYNPAFFNKLDTSIVSGSGFFNKNNFLQISHPINFKNFTIMIKYQNNLNSQANQDGLGEILLEMKDFNNLNGSKLFLGLNDIRKIFLDFSGSAFRTIGLNNPTAKNNIVSLSYSNNNLNLMHFNLFNQNIIENNLSNINLGFEDKNKTLIFGGTKNSAYTGFLGNINNIMIFNKSLSKNDIINISYLLEKTGEFLEQEFSTITGTYTESGYVNPTGILGQGVVNYEIIQEEQSLKNENNTNINAFINLYSGIIGNITGEKLEYIAVQNIEKIITGEKYIDLYNNDSINMYSGVSYSSQNIFDANSQVLFDNEFNKFIDL